MKGFIHSIIVHSLNRRMKKKNGRKERKRKKKRKENPTSGCTVDKALEVPK